MKNVRLAHYYLGVFFAPTILFFALSGVMQVFKLHEAYRGTPGAQGDWIAWMAQVHKEQNLVAPRPAPAKKADSPEGGAAQPEKAAPGVAMRWFTALMGASLFATTLLGLYIAFMYPRRRMAFTVTLAVGLIAPIVLLKMA